MHTLILGSFPSAASLQAGQYYAHPRNQFWPILSAVLGEPLLDLHYDQRLARLRAHAIGLWDVFGSCERAGSLDAAIRNAEANDIAGLRQRLPHLRRLLFNGRSAGHFAPAFAAEGLETAVVPSTSPAHAALRIDAKVALWREALQPLVTKMPARRRIKRR